MRTLGWLTSAFPLWVLSASAVALLRPELFTWFSGPWIPRGLGIIMLGMGLTLGIDDFRRVALYPRLVLLGVALQYTVMPMLGWGLAALLGLPTPLAVGLILVSCCPGGTASNVISYLARADVALSVTMTALSTLAAVIMTPSLTTLLASSRIDVPALGLFWDTFKVVILPLAAGVLLKRYAPRLTRLLLPAAPLLAVVFITLIVASIIGARARQIQEAAASLLLAVVSLHSGGFAVGYAVSRLLEKDIIAARTISIEVGMQNSGLGATLAQGNFADPLCAIPSAISSLTHSLIGSLMAAVWRRRAAGGQESAPRKP